MRRRHLQQAGVADDGWTPGTASTWRGAAAADVWEDLRGSVPRWIRALATSAWIDDTPSLDVKPKVENEKEEHEEKCKEHK